MNDTYKNWRDQLALSSQGSQTRSFDGFGFTDVNGNFHLDEKYRKVFEDDIDERRVFHPLEVIPQKLELVDKLPVIIPFPPSQSGINDAIKLVRKYLPIESQSLLDEAKQYLNRGEGLPKQYYLHIKTNEAYVANSASYGNAHGVRYKRITTVTLQNQYKTYSAEVSAEYILINRSNLINYV